MDNKEYRYFFGKLKSKEAILKSYSSYAIMYLAQNSGDSLYSSYTLHNDQNHNQLTDEEIYYLYDNAINSNINKTKIKKLVAIIDSGLFTYCGNVVKISCTKDNLLIFNGYVLQKKFFEWLMSENQYALTLLN